MLNVGSQGRFWYAAGKKARIPESVPRASEPARDMWPPLGQTNILANILRARAQIADDFRRNSFARGKPEFTKAVFLFISLTAYGQRPGQLRGWPVP